MRSDGTARGLVWQLLVSGLVAGGAIAACDDAGPTPRANLAGSPSDPSAGQGSQGDAGEAPSGPGSVGGTSAEGGAGATPAGPDCGASEQACCPGLLCDDGLRCRGGACQALAVDDFGRACELDAQCVGGLCLPDAAGAFHCSARCEVDEDCVAGWSCSDLDENAGRACQCEPTPETCNGVDDDCNGIVDDAPITKPECVEQVGAGAECQAGACECTGLTCEEACVDSSTDRQNCGACGTSCIVECRAGACLEPTAVRVSDSAACAHFNDGNVRCWGEGPLGDGTRLDRTVPVQLPLKDVVDLDLSFSHACAAKKDGTLRCWGDNSYGKLGVGEARVGDTPVVVPGLHDVLQVALGYHHSCVLRQGGLVSCWGNDLDGQVGTDRAPQTLGPTTPVEIPNLKDVTKLAVGYFHGCALLKDQTVVCWGQNDAGQLGDNTKDSRSKPMPVQDLSGVIDVATGEFHSCALLEGGKLMCWGGNNYGQLGTYSNDPSLVPAEVPFRTYDSVQVSGNLTMALSSGTYYGWGRALPDGQGGWQINRNSPSAMLQFGLGSEATALVDGSEGLLCILSSTDHHCWGMPFGDDSFVEWP